jgi:LPXTG-motif cell wall-anchored protein
MRRVALRITDPGISAGAPKEVVMPVARTLGIVLLAAGLVFLVMGLSATDAPSEQLMHTFLGRYSQQTVWYIAGGLAALAAGAFLIFMRSRR